MSELIHVASATATIAAAVLLPLLVPLLLNDGSLLPLLVLTVKLPQWHSGVLSLLLTLLRCCSRALLFCSQPLVLVLVMLLVVVLFFFPLVMNRHGDAVAFWAEPAGWRSVSRSRPSMPYSLLATHYQLLKITSRQVARSSPSPGRDLGFFFLCIIVDIVVDIALWWSWNCPRTTRRSLHPQQLRLLKMCWWWYFWLLWLMERDRW